MNKDPGLSDEALPALPLPEGITSDFIDCSSSCGLDFHVLKAGEPGNPLILFCHGFPELAYSWRKILPKIAAAGYYCVAPDQRGYGRTLGWPHHQPFGEVELNDFTMTNLVRDLVCLVYGLGYTTVSSIIGHDFGAVSSAMAALMRPDMFRSTVQMSHPHHPPPHPTAPKKIDIQAELAKLDPPRKHYKWYNSSSHAAQDWDNPPQGLEKFLRGYFHLKSADWDKNDPRPLKKWDAKELEVMPEYYIMRDEHSMPGTVFSNMRDEDLSKTERWLSKEDLRVYCDEWARTGFQGALNWYRAQTASTPQSARDMLLFAGRKIEVPCAFISGEKDWGNYQQPGALEAYTDPSSVKTFYFRGARFIEGAGHWVQQEQPDAVIKEILAFLGTL
ncbi:alpha/beta-hydrolase [Annulohypoxylon maeteangense]|uniref:alpha/beta-hydrolase n=1 Tax=Annulohypoxylon maeteangense TaxID=1927788 RepID=UPI002007386D|nr:alpha/beta-hydrolase [Annulohypoxylon maeteangense]KAI0886159.1 alpha/beta-hydrolase [Annulohypoxylon maeteangense]